MITQFCELARKYCFGYDSQIKELEDYAKSGQINDNDILRWYSKEGFFYTILNRLLRAGKDSTEIFYCQHFVKLLFTAIKNVYKK